MAYQSLYRRYRPRRFDEVRGQEHVVGALRNAVRNNSVTHAYLFSGPRGTGKTSTARILAKALNCENLQGGEPCCDCTPCQDMEAGRSFDLFELDAASNNGVDAVRDLIERTAVGSPGRTKVYILDEVHMLSPAASNALLKTLEEPPDHVRFVLATTDPQKVLPTIRSRTQHFEFQLLSADDLETYVRWINNDADLGVDDDALAWAVRQGRGSARDTLSALDQVVAAGGVVERTEPVEQLFQSLADRDSGVAVRAVGEALAQGHDPRVLAKVFLEALRDAFLVSLGAEVPHMMAADIERVGDWASRLGTPLLTRSMEAIGSAMVDMRQAADPRVPLEVALVRLTMDSGGSLAELSERVQKLELALSRGAMAGSGTSATEVARPAEPPSPELGSRSGGGAREEDVAPGRTSGAAKARAELARQRDARSADARASGGAGPAGPTPTGPSAPPTPPRNATRSQGEPTAASSAQPVPLSSSTPEEPEPMSAGQVPGTPENDSLERSLPTATQLQDAMEGVVLAQVRGVAKAIYSQGHFVAVDNGVGIFVVENAPTRDRAEKSRSDVQALLAAHFDAPIMIQVVDKDGAAKYGASGAPGPSPSDNGDPGTIRLPGSLNSSAEQDDSTEADDEDLLEIDIDQLENAEGIAASGVDRLMDAFPGAVLVDTNEEKP